MGAGRLNAVSACICKGQVHKSCVLETKCKKQNKQTKNLKKTSKSNDDEALGCENWETTDHPQSLGRVSGKDQETELREVR